MKKVFTVCISLILYSSFTYCVATYVESSLLFADNLILPASAVILCTVLLLVKFIPDKLKSALFIIVSVIPVCWMLLLAYVEPNTCFEVLNKEDARGSFTEEQNFDVPYEDCTVYLYNSYGLFQQSAKTVILSFGDSFEEAKQEINNNYEFYTEALIEDDPVPVFEFSGFSFRLKVSEKVYPKVMYFVGINEESREIAFVYFNDVDLDCVGEFDSIMYYYCGWQYIELYKEGRILCNVVFG